jgi:hypothetical protein
LDADIVLPPDAIAQMVGLLHSSPTKLAVTTRRRVDTRGRPLAVRAYFAINERLPAFENGLFGRGVVAVSEAGRERFSDFPPLIADDLFLDALFSSHEKAQANAVEVVVGAPHWTKDLLRRLVRVRRGNCEMRAAVVGSVTLRVRPSDKGAWFRQVVVPEPRLAFSAVPYLTITLVAASLARVSRGGWGRDNSTRSVVPSTDAVTDGRSTRRGSEVSTREWIARGVRRGRSTRE